MQIQRQWLEDLIFHGEASRRFTQDSPVLPDVWLAYGESWAKRDPGEEPTAEDLLLTPHASAGTAVLYEEVHKRLYPDLASGEAPTADERDLAANKTTVVVRLTFPELLRVLLPLTEWWRSTVCGTKRPAELRWLVRFVGSIEAAAQTATPPGSSLGDRRAVWEDLLRNDEALEAAFHALVKDRNDPFLCPELDPPPLFLVSRNRAASPTIGYSVQAVKADAARRLFDASCASLTWAIVDSGVDATHPAFRECQPDGTPYREPYELEGKRLKNRTRVTATFDFTRVRHLVSGNPAGAKAVAERIAERIARIGPPPADPAAAAVHARLRRALEDERLVWEAHAADPGRISASADLRVALLSGRTIDWEKVRPFIEISHDAYLPPVHEHGTHVAGILAANWRPKDWPEDEELTDALVGICPDIRLYDFRVFDDAGQGDEFSVMAALQFIRHLNSYRDLPVLHGANLSLAIRHDVANYACGRTPVCDEAERVVRTGVVVVAAAGNYGYNRFNTVTDAGAPSTYEGYSDSSITDPGNADAVITVGSTHRIEPHTYGVSYFSSRGPTGDGRYKPDLLAPGEKIQAPVPGGGHKVKDGTSMAAPHVSGAAALILARHREFIGRPDRVKQILCSTATDLGRDRYFQGAGMVDVLRALQSI